jgi:hypothetical protein
MNIIFPEKQTTIDNSMAKGFVEAAVFWVREIHRNRDHNETYEIYLPTCMHYI